MERIWREGVMRYDGRWVRAGVGVPQETTSFLFRAGRIGALLVYIQGLLFPTRLARLRRTKKKNAMPCHLCSPPCMYIGLLRCLHLVR